MKKRRGKATRKEIKKAPILRQWFQSPVARFLLWFLAFTALLFAISLAPFADGMMQHLVLLDAKCSASILNLAGERSRLAGATFIGGNGITVLRGCSAIEYVWFYCAALLAFPSPPMKKAIGIGLGTLALLFLNLTRIITLQVASVHCPGFFRFFHEEVWDILLVTAILLFCLIWIRWVQRI